MLGHDPCASAEDPPCHQGTDQGVSNAYPGGRNTVFPTELSCVSYENNRGEIGGAVRECREPGTDGAAAQYESVDIGGSLPALETDANHDGKEHQKHQYFDNHLSFLLSSGYSFVRCVHAGLDRFGWFSALKFNTLKCNAPTI